MPLAAALPPAVATASALAVALFPLPAGADFRAARGVGRPVGLRLVARAPVAATAKLAASALPARQKGRYREQLQQRNHRDSGKNQHFQIIERLQTVKLRYNRVQIRYNSIHFTFSPSLKVSAYTA